MAQRLEVFQVGLLIPVMKLKARMLKDGLWRKVVADKLIKGSGTQLLQMYVDRRQATMAELVALHTIFKVCARDMA